MGDDCSKMFTHIPCSRWIKKWTIIGQRSSLIFFAQVGW